MREIRKWLRSDMFTMKTLVLHPQRIQSLASFLSLVVTSSWADHSRPSSHLTTYILFTAASIVSSASKQITALMGSSDVCLRRWSSISSEFLGEQVRLTRCFLSRFSRKYNLRDKLFLWVLARQSSVPSRNCRFLCPRSCSLVAI